MRCGWFYAHDSAQTREFGERLLEREFPIVGGGFLGRRDATLSVLHVDDAASAFVAASEGDATGRYHVIDDETVPLARFVRTLADRLEAPQPRRVPGWLARFLIGKDTVRFLTSSMPTLNDRFRDAFDWEPAVSTIDAGLERVVDRWLETETLCEHSDGAESGYEWVADGSASAELNTQTQRDQDLRQINRPDEVTDHSTD